MASLNKLGGIDKSDPSNNNPGQSNDQSNSSLNNSGDSKNQSNKPKIKSPESNKPRESKGKPVGSKGKFPIIPKPKGKTPESVNNKPNKKIIYNYKFIDSLDFIMLKIIFSVFIFLFFSYCILLSNIFDYICFIFLIINNYISFLFLNSYTYYII